MGSRRRPVRHRRGADRVGGGSSDELADQGLDSLLMMGKATAATVTVALALAACTDDNPPTDPVAEQVCGQAQATFGTLAAEWQGADLLQQPPALDPDDPEPELDAPADTDGPTWQTRGRVADALRAALSAAHGVDDESFQAAAQRMESNSSEFWEAVHAADHDARAASRAIGDYLRPVERLCADRGHPLQSWP